MTAAAGLVARSGLVLIILWFGLLKFTAHEADAIRPLVESSPLLRWPAGLVEPRAFSAMIGVVELAIAALIALRPVSARLAATGSALAIGLFLTTLSFLFSTPGIWEESAGGFPVPGPTAAFLLKDVVLLGVALWSLRESLGARPRGECRGGPACSRA
jgi:uncharacterized membrane protein YkgB